MSNSAAPAIGSSLWIEEETHKLQSLAEMHDVLKLAHEHPELLTDAQKEAIAALGGDLSEEGLERAERNLDHLDNMDLELLENILDLEILSSRLETVHNEAAEVYSGNRLMDMIEQRTPDMLFETTGLPSLLGLSNEPATEKPDLQNNAPILNTPKI